MNKRGQVSVFVIVGVVILILAALIWYLRETGTIAIPSVFLTAEAKKEAVEKNLRECVEKAVRPTIELAALQGGDLIPANYAMYKGNKVAYLCLNIPGKDECLNIMPPIRVIEERLKNNIAVQIDNCVDRGLLEGEETKGTKNLKVDVFFRRNAVLVNTDYDVTLVKGNIQIPIGKVKTVVDNVPFAELYDISHDIVNDEAVTGDFEQLFYMLGKRGRVEIQLDKPYPDKIFIVNKKDSDFKFQFAIQGEEETSRL